MPEPVLPTRSLAAAFERAQSLATAGGVHGAYVRNALAQDEGQGFVYGEPGAETGLCWFGPRGNLVVLEPSPAPAPPAAVAAAIQCARLSWRLAMGPPAIVDALRARCVGAPLVHRTQVYYVAAGGGGTAPADAIARAAGPADRDRLVQAALQLNHSDLAIDPKRVDRRWLYETIDARIAAGNTRVIGPPGRIECKLDVGSAGPGGGVLEGVFTFRQSRGHGLATALVRAVIASQSGGVCLHVAEHNAPARSAYERAGMREVGRCRLLLLG